MRTDYTFKQVYISYKPVSELTYRFRNLCFKKDTFLGRSLDVAAAGCLVPIGPVKNKHNTVVQPTQKCSTHADSTQPISTVANILKHII